MPSTRFLLISNAGDTAVADALRTAGLEAAVVPDVDTAITTVSEPGTVEVVILDLGGPIQVVVDAGNALHGSDHLRDLPILCVTQTDDVEDRIRLLEAGIDDVIARPFDPRELDARAEALALRLQRSRGHASTLEVGVSFRDGSQRRIITVFSPKGGVGTTTVAVNVATSLASQMPGGVVILDLDFQFGQVATHLNITPRLTMAELSRDEATLRDPGLFQSSLDRHGSGLMVLGAPATPDASSNVSEASIVTLLATATAAFKVVVVDAGSALDSRAETALAKATDLVIVVTPEFPALKAVHALSELLANSSGHTAETSYVLNEIFARELLRRRDIEEALGTHIALTIPYDAFAFLKSVNEGVPIVDGSPNSAAAEQLRRLAARLAGLPGGSAPPERRSKGLGGLFSRG